MGIPLRGCGRWIACQIRMPLGSNPSRATKERNPSLLSPARRSAGADSRRVSRIDLNFGSGSTSCLSSPTVAGPLCVQERPSVRTGPRHECWV